MYAVQQFKFDNMRSFITVLFTFFSLLGLTQAENGVINNSNMNSNSVESESLEEESLQLDTVAVLEKAKEVEELKSDQRKLKKSAAKKELKQAESKGYMDESPSAPVPAREQNAPGSTSIETSSEYRSVSSEFSYSKKQASVQRTQRSPSVNQQVQMNQAVDYFESNSPNSFEFHYFKYVSGNYDVDLVTHLQEAENIRPDNADVQVQLAAYNMIKRNNDSAIGYLDKLKTAGRLTDNVLHYAEDILLSVPENGVLITHGFDDSYATWYKQNNSEVRMDVQIVSLDFMQSEHYRQLLKEDGYKIPESKVIDLNFLKSFCEMNETKNISISLTTPKEYFKPLQNNLYITGLVFEYHEVEFNNFERNDDLWNTTLKKHLVDNATDEKSKQLSSNYLPMLLQLRKVYVKSGEEEKLKQVDEASDKVSVQCRKYEQVQKLKNSY